jgi:formate dehydrogenase major subunit
MLTLTIDGIEIEVADGTTVMNAAKIAGIEIPRLCHHPNLKPYGGCRLCMVEIEGARILQPSCTLPVTQGMVVHTNTVKVQDARKFVLSLIFSERNHFCMYCQATDGDCDLQNAAYDQDMTHWPLTPNYSPFPVDASHKYFVLDNNRCILCRRCVRACGELVGNFTLGFEERGSSSLLVADYGVPLGESSCISCGTCVQICPTGALIDRMSAYQGRLTDVEHHHSVCIECSVGCQRNILTRDNRLVRIEGVWDAPLNEGLLCIKGRYETFDLRSERILTPIIRENGKQRAATWDEALTLIINTFKSTDRNSLAALASSRLPAEFLVMFKKTFEEGLNTKNIGTLEPNEAAVTSRILAEKLGKSFESKLDVLKNTDVALIIGTDLVEDHQVASFFLKRQILNETKIITYDYSENKLFPRSIEKLQQIRGSVDDFINSLTTSWQVLTNEKDNAAVISLGSYAEKTGIDSEQLLRTTKILGDAGQPVIVVGEKLANLQNFAAFEKLVLFAQQIRASLVVIKDKANSLTAAQLNFCSSIEFIKVKAAFIALGDETPSTDVIKKWGNIPFLAVSSAYTNYFTDKADVVLPSVNWAEEAGMYINSDGRYQEKITTLTAPEGILDSCAIIQKLADLVHVNYDDNWKSLILSQVPSVELDII